ncbi:hypothetical protein VTK73DRAFT_8207 [Phialemonium thermophilum]|uniref:F-box domain-containing protein n=1 Tax=Phialemonium thermophilum TaxID=223376 RepID=A0ABR3W9Q2_9PEZI
MMPWPASEPWRGCRSKATSGQPWDPCSRARRDGTTGATHGSFGRAWVGPLKLRQLASRHREPLDRLAQNSGEESSGFLALPDDLLPTVLASLGSWSAAFRVGIL